MEKFLSIVIPHYSETERDMFPLLSSIAGQVGIDFNKVEVIIANDGVEPVDKDFLGLFDCDIWQTTLTENGGPGVARQAGLDVARGEYVMFCDADDTLHSVGVLGALIQEAQNNHPDILTSSWLEELVNPDGTYRYITHENENTWMHGKFLRCDFLRNNNVRFHPELRVHEDSYFLSIAASLTKQGRYIPLTSYVWKYHPNSITRRNNAVYTFDSHPTFVKAVTMSYSEIEKRNPALMEFKVLQFTLYNFFVYHQPHWLAPERKEYLNASVHEFVQDIKPFWHYWQDAAPETIAQVYTQERARSFNGCIETETLSKWLKRLGLSAHK